MWDKNRPTRMIPRAEVYTSSDVTVEELRGEGEEPTLTAESLAERLGDIRRSTTRTRSEPVRVVRHRTARWRYARARAPRSRRRQHADRLRAVRGRRARRALAGRDRAGRARATSWRVLLGGLLDLGHGRRHLPLDSTVPPLVREYEEFAERWAHAPLLVVGPGVKTGIPIRYDDPREVGPDRIANAVAALERYGAPCDRRRLRYVDELRRRLTGRRVRRRRARARDRGLDGRPLRARGATREGRLRRRRRTVIGKTTRLRPPVRARLRVRRPG